MRGKLSKNVGRLSQSSQNQRSFIEDSKQKTFNQLGQSMISSIQVQDKNEQFLSRSQQNGALNFGGQNFIYNNYSFDSTQAESNMQNSLQQMLRIFKKMESDTLANSKFQNQFVQANIKSQNQFIQASIKSQIEFLQKQNQFTAISCQNMRRVSQILTQQLNGHGHGIMREKNYQNYFSYENLQSNSSERSLILERSEQKIHSQRYITPNIDCEMYKHFVGPKFTNEELKKMEERKNDSNQFVDLLLSQITDKVRQDLRTMIRYMRANGVPNEQIFRNAQAYCRLYLQRTVTRLKQFYIYLEYYELRKTYDTKLVVEKSFQVIQSFTGRIFARSVQHILMKHKEFWNLFKLDNFWREKLYEVGLILYIMPLQNISDLQKSLLLSSVVFYWLRLANKQYKSYDLSHLYLGLSQQEFEALRNLQNKLDVSFNEFWRTSSQTSIEDHFKSVNVRR